jgi:hypothetical protein
VAIRNAAEEPQLHDPDAPYNEVIPTLVSLSDRVQDLTDKAKRYARYQEILRLQVTTFEALGDLKADVTMKLKVGWLSQRRCHLRG